MGIQWIWYLIWKTLKNGTEFMKFEIEKEEFEINI